jgi:hypothetical protein
MNVFKALVFVAAISTAAICASAAGGVLEKATKIQVDPTVVEHPENVNDKTAANLARYDLRAAVRDAHLEEGQPADILAHIVLDGFSSESRARQVIDMGSGRSICTVDARLVFEDASGKELANIKIHVRGSVVPVQGDAAAPQGREPTSDLERRLLREIEALK